MNQEQGIVGRFVGGLIRRSVKARFHTIYWQPPAAPISQPSIFLVNHHGWFDGYLMFLALSKLKYPFLDWVEEYHAFPLFGKVGGMPFPANKPIERANTIRKTIRKMNSEQVNLLLFGEGVLHYGPEILPLGRALELVAKKAEVHSIVPVSIIYEHAMHERPEAFVQFSNPTQAQDISLETLRAGMESNLAGLRCRIREDKQSFQVLHKGTPDVNERWDMRRLRK